ncbi:uncharacterized protein [Typha latifolia]|uniref:uncharacterized protein n=1 Tax=Typha latifolia TaxID=4733 RepID=UPI003C2C6363
MDGSGRKKKGCELCSGVARMYCESDEAMLCWDCDSRVHGANFLVARHSRVLLCRTCQSPTPWRASGARLGPTVSLCERCCPRRDDEAEGGAGEEEEEGEEEEVESEEEEEEEEDMEEGDGENQVVPWSPPPPVASSSSSSSSEESSIRIECQRSGARGSSSLKRMRDNADLASQSQVDHPSSSSQSQRNHFWSAGPPFPALAREDDEATSSIFRFPKDRKRSPGHLFRPAPAQPGVLSTRPQRSSSEPSISFGGPVSTTHFVGGT